MSGEESVCLVRDKIRKGGRAKLPPDEKAASVKASREKQKAKRRQAAAKKKEMERMVLAQTDAVKYYSSTAQGAVKEGFAIAATRLTHQSYAPLGYPLHSNQRATIQQQQQQMMMMINAQMATAAQMQAQFMMQASAAAAAAAAAATKVARDTSGGVAHAASHSMLPLLLAGMPHGGMTMVQSGLQNGRGEQSRRDDGSNSESLGDSSGKEDTSPKDPDVATAPKKRNREKNDEEENENADNPSSACKQRVDKGSHSNQRFFDDGTDDAVGPFADDDEAHAGIGDNTDGISCDAAIPFADNVIDNADDDAKGHSRPNVLLLGMSYPSISSLFGSNADPSPRDIAEAVENGKITQIDARDLVRARALEKFADVRAHCVSLENAANYDKDRHLRANFNDVSTKTKSFLSRLQSAWSGKKFQEIILDYFWSPSSWVSDHWKSSFFSTVLPAFVTKGVLEEGGTVYLPSCLHCVCEITAAIQCLSKVYRITFLHKSDLDNHKLWAACNSMESDVKDNFLRWFGHAMGEEEKYCKLSIQCLGGYMCPDSKVRMGDVKQILNQIKRLEGVRMVVLSALTASEKESRSGGFDFS